ncbi:phosphoglycerate dehydrogenase [Peptostreptococcus equinus]|uniref:Phosphoglycerate dehydrogenase n=1 Tax=Peptostreptococcus equinus TaxID=3003601 RepID=A0ABY7JP36_9FIRM|nr:phosphoglycerate dehydrogenase [Peptostreptococcus sp. CBA3647]WAW14929.1 phosphoglycerate dehydrogenase [Peptostreptococcus sp. CBA3647]
MKILINRNLGKEKMKAIEDLGYEILHIPEKNLKENDDIYDIDVWFTYYGFEKVDISKMKNLKYIHLTSTGYDQVPIDYILDNNIYLSNNTTGYAIPMAESIVMYILEVYKNAKTMFENQKEHKWKIDMSFGELAGKKVGFLGTGNIAKEAAKRLKAFDCKIWGLNTNGRDVENFDKCYSTDNINDLLKECDVVVGLMPATNKTNGLINKEKFEIMKENSIFLNIGRGNLVNLKDLEKYVDKFRGVVLDVVENEPLDENSSLWDSKNVIITPHNSWVSDQNLNRLGERLYDNLKNYMEKGIPKTYIKDIKRGY